MRRFPDRAYPLRLLISGFACLLLMASPSPARAQEAQALRPDPLRRTVPDWLGLRGEFRGRLEGARHAAFNPAQDDLYWLNRLRFSATLRPTESLSLRLEAHDARVARKQIGSTAAPFTATLDLRQAYGTVGTERSRLAVRVGRQELAFGEQRLVGHVSWLNAARTFDAARLTIRRPRLVVDAFGATVVRILDDRWDRSGNGSQFHGVYAVASGIVPQASVEPYVFWRGERTTTTESGVAGRLSVVTVGVRAAGRLGIGTGRPSYAAEFSLQRGRAGTDEVHAWASHARLDLPASRHLILGAEYNYASGDANPTDGRRGTFDPLYPTPHDKYGLADQVGWRNMHHVRAGFTLTRWPSMPVRAGYHHWWLADARDALYTPGGAALARLPAGAPSRHVGHEIDIQVTRALGRRAQVAAGYALVLPGAFLEATTAGVRAHFPFAMLTFVFLDSP